MLPREDRIRIELPITDLVHLAALADLGFKRMMPNDRDIETLRFGDEQQAWDAARSIERVDSGYAQACWSFGVTTNHDPQLWPLERKRA